MGFQNTINNALGAVGAAATLGKHMINQKEQLANQEKELANQKEASNIEKSKLELKLADQEDEAYKAQMADALSTQDIKAQMQKDLDPKIAGPVAEGKIDENSYLYAKQNQAIIKAQDEYDLYQKQKDSYLKGDRKTKPSSKRLDMANRALREASEAVMAKEQLQRNLEMAMKRVGITQKALEGVK